MHRHHSLRRRVPAELRPALLALLGCALGACAGRAPDVTCGPGTVLNGRTCEVDPTVVLPRVSSVALTQLELPGADQPLYSLGELVLRGTLSVVAEDVSTDVGIGLESKGAQAGCVVGAFALDHVASLEDPATPVEHAFEQTVRLTADCKALEGRDDVTVFLSFDPFRATDVAGRPGEETPPPEGETADPPDALPSDGSMYELAKGSEVVAAAGCQGCQTALRVRPSPGRDVVLLDVSLASSVAVLEVPSAEVPAQTEAEILAANQDAGVPEPPAGTVAATPAIVAPRSGEPAFFVAASFRTLGLGADEVLAGEQVQYAAHLRPLPGGLNVQNVPSAELDWLPLHAAPPVNGTEQLTGPVQGHTGADEPSLSAALHLEGSVFTRLTSGSWATVEEFELRFCLVPAFAEAVYEGELAPRENNCLQGPVVVTRKEVTPAGPALSMADRSLSTSWERQLAWTKLWGSRDKASAELAFWLTMGFTGSTGSTNFGLGGSSMSGKGGWYEAGSRATSCVFGVCADLARATITLKDHQDKPDTFFMEGRILIFDFLPRVALAWPDGKLTLANIFALAAATTGKEYSSVKSFEKALVGKKITIPVVNKTLEAAVKAFVDMGLDDGDTAVEKQPLAAAPPPCQGKTVVAGQCFASASTGWHSLATLDQRCRADYGTDAWPAVLRTQADFDAALAASNLAAQFLVGHVYEVRSSSPGGNRVAPWRLPSGLYVPSLYSEPLSDPSPYPAVGTRMQLVYQVEQGFQAWPLTTRVETGVCGIRDRAATLGGSKITATIAPFISAGVRATVKGEFGGLKAFAEGTLSLIKVSLAFVGSLAGRFGADQTVALELGRSITLTVSTLSGGIDVGASLDFRAPCVPKFWKKCSYKVSGKVNILSWKGLSLDIPVLPLETTTHLL